MADRTVRAIITGSSAGAVKAFAEVGAASELSGNKIGGTFSKASNDVQKNMASSIPGFSKFGALMSNPYALAAVAVVGAATTIAVVTLDLANKYQDATNKMAANAGITIAAAKQIGDAFLTTGGQTTFSAQQMMEAFGPVAGQLALTAGHALSTAESMTFMAAAMNLAEATSQPLGATVAALSQVMQAYAIPAAKAAAATDLLTNVAHGLAMPIDVLVAAVDKLHAKLGPLAPSLLDVGTLLTDVASHGLTGSRALMLVSTGMNTLLGGSKATTAELTKLHVSVFTASGRFVGMQSVIAQLAPKLAAMTEQHRLYAEKALFGAGASKALDATIMAGLPGWDRAAKAASLQGSAAAGAQKATSGLGASFEKLKGAVTDAGIQIGQKLQPILAILVAHLATAAKWLATNLPGALTVLGNIFSRTFTVIGVIVSVAIRIMSTEIGIITAVVMRLGVIFSVIGASIYNVLNATVIPIIKAVSGPISAVAHVVGTILVGAFNALMSVATFVFRVIGDAVNAVLGPIEAVVGAIGKVAGGIGSAFGAVGSFLTHVPGHAGGGVIAAGGFGIVGENGPELAYGGTSGMSIFNRSQVPSGVGSMGAGEAGGTVINLHIYPATGAVVPDAIVNALRQYQSRNGSLPFTVNAARRLGAA